MTSDYLPNSILSSIMQLEPVKEISPNDTMLSKDKNMRHYLSVGRSALLVINAVLTARMSYAGGDAAPESILDFGAGYGRVARFLRAGFPRARVEVTDRNTDGTKWCVEILDALRCPAQRSKIVMT